MLSEKVCRVCLSECNELTPLWVKLPGENKTLEETINFVVNINIKLEDGLPDKICKICESVLDLADTFKQRCLESEWILQQQAQPKQSDESQPKCEENYQENSEMRSNDTSCLPSSMSHTSVTDSLRKISENIYDLPEHRIKMEIVEHYVDAGVTISAQESLDTIQDFETSAKSNKKCFIKELSEENMKLSNNKEIFSCPHCGQTFYTKISYKVHILYKCEPKVIRIFNFKCALCKETFTNENSFEVHLRTHKSQKNTNCGDSQPVLFLSEELHQGEDTIDHAWPLAPHQTEAPSPNEPKLDDMQPTTAAVRSPTEDPAAADTSTDTVIKIEANFDEAENFRFIKMENCVKNFKLEEKGEKIICKNDTATMLKLSGTNTDDKITGATETQATCISNTVIGTTGHILTCDICGYTTATIRSLNAHLKAHAATKRYSCESCLYLTINLNNFNKHVRTHTGEKPYYSCHECEKKFSLRVHLLIHLRTHTGKKPYTCDVCQKKFALKSQLLIHRRLHTGERPYSCDVCDMKFIRKDGLVAHASTHIGGKPYSCDVCEMKFIRKDGLVAHASTHIGGKPYSCDVCEMKFIRKDGLVAHANTHIGGKPYSCDVCEMKFIRKDGLVAHASTHIGGKPYSCDVCEMKFINICHLRRHVRIHTGEKPHSCNICLQKFTQKSHLNRHLRTHTGEKPYSCDKCEWKFSQNYSLLRHIRKAHT